MVSIYGYVSIFVFSVFITYSHASITSLEISQKRVRDHLVVKDYVGALSDLKISLAQFPQSKELQILMVRVLSESGYGSEAFKQWKYVTETYPEVKDDWSLIEAIAWSILAKAESSSQQIVNISSMIGASLTKDAKAVYVLQRYLRSTNAYLRMVAIRLATQYGDKKLIEEIQTMLTKESVWYVRLEILRALGQFQRKEITALFKEIVASSRSSIEERGVAAQGLLTLYDHLDDFEFKKLLESPRAGLRYLACEVVSYLNLKEKSEQIASLLQDTSAEVKIAALNTLSVVGISKEAKEEILSKVIFLTQDAHPCVSITACRLLMYYRSEIALPILEKWIAHENADLARLAACALSLSGSSGKKTAMRLLQNVDDHFIRVNLAYGMLGEEESTNKLCKAIAEFLSVQEGKIMFDVSMNPLFKMIAPSRIKHTPEMAHYPQAVDQHTRLHLLNTLAMMRYPKAEESIKHYLQSQSIGMTYAASTALIEEGAEDSIEIIRELLSDPDEKIRVQAALVLAMLGGEKEALQVLKDVYPKVDRELKIAILEALGHIGSKEEIPFLMRLLEDPFNVMKVIAASAIIQCIYH